MSNALKVVAVGGVAAAETDANFNQTVLLLHGDGTNGAQNNTFLDGSTNNFTITRNGNTTQGTFSPFSVGPREWSNYFDGSGDTLTFPTNAAFEFGTGDFSVETWAYLETQVNYGAWLQIAYGAGLNAYFQVDNAISPNHIRFVNFPGAVEFNGGLVSTNGWVHLLYTRKSGTMRLFVNGVLGANGTDNTNYTGVTGVTLDAANFRGYFSNTRIIKGGVPSAYDTASTTNGTTIFTPPTAPFTGSESLTAGSVSLLTCQSNRFVDNSTNAFAITRNGDVKVTPFSPFAPSAAYSASTNGGSGYFDGTGDYLLTPSTSSLAMGTGDFCLEAWIYPTAPSGSQVIYGNFASGGVNTQMGFFIRNGNSIRFSSWDTAFLDSAAGTIVGNQWHHIAISRVGNNLALFINGTRAASASGSPNNFTSTNAFNIGRNPNNTEFFIGYIANLRIIKGSSPYDPTSTTLTVPTAPLTAITNTSLLCNFTNAGILDNTGKNNLETVGNAQIDTTTKKFGTGSLEFDGTGDWLLVPNSPDIQLGTGNFTIEFWVYLASGDTGSARGLVAKGGASTGWLVSLDSSQKVVFTYTTSTITSSGAITTNAWNHIAVVRSGTGSNQTKIYIAGTNDGTGTVSTDFNQTEVLYVGCNRAAGDPMKGFIDDLRITKGVARYTANFTAPTKAFPDQ